MSDSLVHTQIERGGREKFKTELLQSLLFDVKAFYDGKLDKEKNDKQKIQEKNISFVKQ